MCVVSINALDHIYKCLVRTWGSSNPSQAKHTIIKVPVSKDVGQAVVIMVLLRVKLQKLLNSNVGKAKRIRRVPFLGSGIHLEERRKMSFLTRIWFFIQMLIL